MFPDSEKDCNFEHLKKTLEFEKVYKGLNVKVQVVRNRKPSRFSCQDIQFELIISEGSSGNVYLIDVFETIRFAVYQLFENLRKAYDKSKKRLIYMTCLSQALNPALRQGGKFIIYYLTQF